MRIGASRGYEAVGAGGGPEALAAVEREAFDAVVLDAADAAEAASALRRLRAARAQMEHERQHQLLRGPLGG